MKRKADNFIDFQERAREFSVGDIVVPFGYFDSQAGRVTAVWPAIGMADVEFPTGNKRWPVEDLQRFVDGNADPTHTDSTAGGIPTVSVPGGPTPKASAQRIAQAFTKKALYWAQRDRKYRMNGVELSSGKPCCPRCEGSPPLKKGVYKRRGDVSVPLLGCPNCMFLIKAVDIVNHPDAQVEDEGV